LFKGLWPEEKLDQNGNDLPCHTAPMSELDEVLLDPQPEMREREEPNASNEPSTPSTDDAAVIFAQLESEVFCTAISPDGRRVIAGVGDGTLQLFDLITGDSLGQPFQGHGSSVRSVAFSPDGQTIVSGSDDRTLRLWKLDGTAVGQPFQGHGDSVRSVAFSPDGQTIVSGSADRTLRLWKLDGTAVGQPFQGHGDYVRSVAFSPDGQTIVSGSADTSVSLWKLDTDFKAQRVWFFPGIVAIPIRNLDDRIGQVSIPQGIANDLAQGEDQLKVKDELEALATVLMLRSLQPPIAVGILGSWGSGKSFGMYLIRQKIGEIRRQTLKPFQAWGDPAKPERTDILSPYVGHIYQIEFNAWTYAKSDLWASLMQEIFYELNRQISLEKQLGHILIGSPQPASGKTLPPNGPLQGIFSKIVRSDRLIDRFVYTPLSNTKLAIQRIFKQLSQKLTVLTQRILSLWFIQLVWHIAVFIFILLIMLLGLFLFLLASLGDRLTGEKFDITSKLNNVYFSWLGKQWEYYFQDNSGKVFKETWIGKAEFILEHILFFLFAGFPQRLKDRRQYWQNLQAKPNPPSPPGQQPFGSEATANPIAYAKALREGGDFWQVLYLMSEEERTAFLEAKLQPDQFKHWETLTSQSEISHHLWDALDKIKQKEQQDFKQKEENLQNKEKDLQRQLKSAEVGVNRQLAQRSFHALWVPIVNAIARLRFSKEEIESFAITGETAHLFRKTLNSWQGLLALFLMALVAVLALDEATRNPIIIAIADFIEQPWLVYLFHQWVPDEVIKTVVTVNTAIVRWFSNLPLLQVLTVFIPLIPILINYLTSVQKEQARIQSERDVLLQQEQSKAEGLVKEVAQLKLQVEEQRKRVGLTANYASLMDFVSDRLNIDDYGKHLGLMQQVKQDLAALSDRLTDQTHNREELQQCFPRGPARVILYIDDLDRCPPKRVVEVLEAVQLLLNTKLFIVVLGIDDRYIARALEQVYQGVLKRGGKPSGIDYLEKIIQIPYRMRPISPATVESYLRSQLHLRPSTPPPTSPTTQQTDQSPTLISPAELTPPLAQENGNGEVPSPITLQSNTSDALNPPGHPIQQDSEPSFIAPDTKDPPIEQPAPMPVKESPSSIETTPKATDPTEPTPPAPSASPEALKNYLETVAAVTELDEDEFNVLVNCCKHVDITPRTAKRLINIYKILQIIWSTRKETPTPQQKRIVMAFLALSGRYPTYMRNLFEEIDVRLEDQQLDWSDSSTADNPTLQVELNSFVEEIKPPLGKDDRHAQREWRRFTGDIQRMVQDPERSPDEPIELAIDRKTFDLMLSFCFVGDIGYDPNDYHPNSPNSDNPPCQDFLEPL